MKRYRVVIETEAQVEAPDMVVAIRMLGDFEGEVVLIEEIRPKEAVAVSRGDCQRERG